MLSGSGMRAVYLLACILTAVCRFESDCGASADKPAAKVLYINSYHRGYRWSDGIEQGLRARLAASGRNIEFYIEYLDTQRFPDLAYFPYIADILAIKHRRINYNVIVVSDNNAFDFVVKYRQRLFPYSAVVFCGFNAFRPENVRGMKDITGVNEDADFKSTIDIALGIHKRTNTLVFVTSDYYSSGKINMDRVEKELIPVYEKRYKITELKNLYMRDLEERLPSLPENSLLFVFGSPFDNFDRQFIPSGEYYRRVAAASSVPAYSFWDYTIDTGMMGGKIITGPDQGDKAGELVLMILGGIAAGNIPVVMESPAGIIFDFNAMKRFGLSERDLPPGSRIINRPDTFYSKYWVYVWITAVILLILAFMVIVLAMQLGKSRVLALRLSDESEKRQKVVHELEEHKEHLETIVDERTTELRRTYEIIKERELLFRSMFDMHSAAMYLLNPDTGRIIDANQSALEFYGYTLDEIKSIGIYSINPMSKDEINRNMELTKNKGKKKFEFSHRIADGTMRDVEVYSTPIPYKGEVLLFAIVHDITERKTAEDEREKLIEELKQALAQVRTLSGLLPICSSCKKIRNDKGYWEQIETYIGDHSDAEFSHSLCPDCAERLYPGIKRKIDGF